MFKTPLPFTVPSFLLGAAMGLDMGSTMRPRSYRAYLAARDDASAILSDFVVIGDDLEDGVRAELDRVAAAGDREADRD